jgi:hypothetical protein
MQRAIIGTLLRALREFRVPRQDALVVMGQNLRPSALPV